MRSWVVAAEEVQPATGRTATSATVGNMCRGRMAWTVTVRKCRWAPVGWKPGPKAVPTSIGGAVTATLEEAAFGQRPDLLVTAVPGEPRARWLAAVVLGGQGRYARAA